MSSSNKVTSKEYFEKLLKAFPKLELEYDEEFGIHYNMERFADYTLIQIDSKNWQELQNCFKFQDDQIAFIDTEIENALNVSYCESIVCHLSEDVSIVKLMPPRFCKFYEEYRDHYLDLTRRYNQ